MLAAAIYLGRSSAKWTFSFRDGPTKAFSRHWVSGSGSLVSLKTPFCLLVEPDKKTLSCFGYDAENKFAELREEKIHEPYYFCTNIARLLERKCRQAQNKVTEITIEDEMGKSLPALTVLTLAIDYLKNDLQNAIFKQSGGFNLEEDVYIVLTVPPFLQGSRAIELIRKAALNCGISAGKMSIITDLDAASVFYQYGSSQKTEKLDTALFRRPKAMRYLVVKAGVTTDAVVHEVEQNGQIKEASSVSTCEYGAILVDKAIENFFKELIGEHVWDKFKVTMPCDYLDLTREIEVKRRHVPAGTGWITLKIPVSLLDHYQEETRKQLKDSINVSTYSGDVKLGGDKLRLSANVFRSFFNEATEKIISMIKTTLRNAGQCDLLMYGGFADSQVLQQAVQSSLPNINVVFYEDTLKGAVIAAHVQQYVRKMETATKAVSMAALQ